MNNDPRPRCVHEVVYPMDNCVDCVKEKLDEALKQIKFLEGVIIKFGLNRNAQS